MVGFISKDDELAYKEEVRRLTDWGKVNVDKMKEMVVDFRRPRNNHSLLGVHLAENLTWSLNTSSIAKKVQQCLYLLQRLKKAHLPPPHPYHFLQRDC